MLNKFNANETSHTIELYFDELKNEINSVYDEMINGSIEDIKELYKKNGSLLAKISQFIIDIYYMDYQLQKNKTSESYQIYGRKQIKILDKTLIDMKYMLNTLSKNIITIENHLKKRIDPYF